MGTRTEILVELAREVLGPRNGPQETIADDPRDEYITGMLGPIEDLTALPNVEPDLSDDPDSDVIGDEDDDDDTPASGSPPASPSLDPRQLPRSMGLSFAITGERPQIRLCCTWARYSSTGSVWTRLPTGHITDWIDVDGDHSPVSVPDDVTLHIRVRRMSTDLFKVSIYLTNARHIAAGQRASTSDFIFQPQIRVRLAEGTQAVSLDTLEGEFKDAETDAAAEESRLNLLYRERKGFARGHMCGATWREIDPERHAGAVEGERIEAPPFAWTDRGAVPHADALNFSPADIRTDFLPCYSIQSPETEWLPEFGAAPGLDADILAETWDGMALRALLEPLARGYESWLVRCQQEAATLDEVHRSAAELNLRDCATLLTRLDEAIGLLTTDDNTRLAFCFANKAMAMQAHWSRGTRLQWRPFQLAFMLASIPSTADPLHPDRILCDLLWFPTGGGKTEAYLGLAAFTLAHRRIAHERGAGTAVISRYTLRLLTIQQFRRALSVVTACEVLRVQDLSIPGGLVGWRPAGCSNVSTFLWGSDRFSAALWVGGNVTPNKLQSTGTRVANTNTQYCFVGAIDLLRGARHGYAGPDQRLARELRGQQLRISGDPAQVTACPCCHQMLAVPEGGKSGRGLAEGDHILYIPHAGGRPGPHVPGGFQSPDLPATVVSAETHMLRDAFVTAFLIHIDAGNSINAQQVDLWWARTAGPAAAATGLLCARPSRPGYVLVSGGGAGRKPTDFEILCPNPSCDLNRGAWAEGAPVLRSASNVARGAGQGMTGEGHADLPPIDGWWQDPPMQEGRLSARVFGRIPIPACTVDDQIYARCPSLVVATVDKFARLAFEPRASALFGNVTHYHAKLGYYRFGACPIDGLSDTFRPHPPGGPGGHNVLHRQVAAFRPPELVIQDELHLIEGPLGSMVGLYESAVETLCSFAGPDGRACRPKYVASTATIRQAATQVQALFDRTVAQFPPSGLDINDSFFAVTREPHQLDEAAPGRLYVGLAAPGKGAQTPIVRLWTSLLQQGYARHLAVPNRITDRFYTLAAYFNAVRELAGAATLYRQDIPQRLDHQYQAAARDLGPDVYMELSSRVNSMELPTRLADLERRAGFAAVCATSMFGTGVDVDRLGLMAVHGQPKTTATYIQATGRVGRSAGALVVAFLRASRPRDLDHYEYFTAYHRALYRHVEAITVSPFAPKARDRCLGPLSVAFLRQAAYLLGQPVHPDWRVEQRLSGRQYHSEARRMAAARRDPEVAAMVDILEARSQIQPLQLRPSPRTTASETSAELDAWQRLARQAPTRDDLVYWESASSQTPDHEVVLGDPQHQAAGLDQAFENAPNSLREVEETTAFKT